MAPYPLDYQLALAQTIRTRLCTAESHEQAARLRDALARLQRSSFGQCAVCGGVIPYFEIAANPAAQNCHDCR